VLDTGYLIRGNLDLVLKLPLEHLKEEGIGFLKGKMRERIQQCPLKGGIIGQREARRPASAQCEYLPHQ